MIWEWSWWKYTSWQMEWVSCAVHVCNFITRSIVIDALSWKALLWKCQSREAYQKQDSLLVYVIHSSASTACNCHGLMAFPTPEHDTGSQNIHQCDNKWDVQCAGLNSNRQPFFYHCGESQRHKLLFGTVSISNLIILRWVHIWIQSLLDLVSMTMGMQMHRKTQCTSIVYANVYSMLDKAECHHKIMLCLLHQGRVFIL